MHHYLVDFDQILQEGLRIATTRPIDPDLLAEMARRVRDRIGPYGWIRFFESYLATPSAQLAAIDIPVHLVHGALDTAAPPDGSRALLDGLSPWCPAALTELEASAHFPMLDEPEKVWSVIEKTRFSSYLQRPRSRKATA
jgi:pimeloyl-ACP methyl ester carboxylesterase